MRLAYELRFIHVYLMFAYQHTQRKCSIESKLGYKEIKESLLYPVEY